MPGIHSGRLTRLIYISRSTLARDDVMPGLRAISATATARNAHLGITGALLHTGSHFAQVIAHGPVAARQFSAWMTVYNGHAGYVQRFLDSCLAHPGSPGEQAKLLRLFREFSRDLLEAG